MKRLTPSLLLAAALLAGCATPDKPVRPTLYDLGPGMAGAASVTVTADQTPLMLGEIDAAGTFDGTALLYRLGYADANQLRSYALARWSATPGQLLRLRLRERIGRDRPVIDQNDAASLARTGGRAVRLLRVELEEFTHHFDSPAQSTGRVRVRVTLLESTPAGERLVAQRRVAMQQPAPTPDAPGGVRAIAAAVDAAADDIATWVRAQP